MVSFERVAGAALLCAFAMTAFVPAGTTQARAAAFQLIGGVGDNDNSWENASNWTPAGVPGSGDTVFVPTDHGVAILDGNSESVQSIVLDGGLNVNAGGTLNVSGNITNNGADSAYFVNGGTIVVNGTIIVTCTNCNDPDTAYFGYIGNSHQITGNLDNSGSVVNGDGVNGLTGVSWTGDVDNKATGYISNSGALWTGNIVGNDGAIYNDAGATWIGDVQSNTASIQNDGGSSWQGNIVGNGATGVINNLEGGTWTGDVQSNDGSVNNDGGTWNGNVVSNNGTVFNTADSTWNGNMTSAGSLVLAGTVNGFVNNSGYLYVNAPLSGVTSLTNTGAIIMEDNAIDASISAQSWSGTGTATFDFAPGLGRSDHVVLSGNYTADTALDLNLVGPYGRALVDIPLIEVGGTDTGMLTVTGLPEDGVVSYRVVQNDQGWIVTSMLNDAPAHAAAAAALLARATAEATRVPTDQADSCGNGRWVRGLGSAQSGTLSGTPSSLALGGAQFGYDLACLPVANGATVGIGVTGGALGGRFAQDFGNDDHLDGSFGEGFGGIYGDLAAGRWRAMLQAQMGVSVFGMSDPLSAVEGASLSTTHFDLSGEATYEFVMGRISLLPEVGFTAANVSTSSGRFADVGAMSLTSGETLDTYAGGILKARIGLPDGATTVVPYLRLRLHAQPLAPSSVLFTDYAGGSATLPLDRLGAYGELEVGADLLRAPGAGGRSVSAGVTADFKFGSNVNENSYSGYARMTF